MKEGQIEGRDIKKWQSIETALSLEDISKKLIIS